MKLDELYSLRRNFTIIGLTGRTGSGCTKIAERLSQSFDEIEHEGLRSNELLEEVDPIFRQKYNICLKYLKHENNWTPFKIIKYKDVLLFFIINKYGGDRHKMKELLLKFYTNSSGDNNKMVVSELMVKINRINHEYLDLINEIKKLNLKNIKSVDDLEVLNRLFFDDRFSLLSQNLLKILEDGNGYFRRTRLFHFVACNIRKNGDPLDSESTNISSIYSIAYVINRIIKARKRFNGENPTRIVIDSLRNSLEIMFFKERYSAFYMIATKDVLNKAEDRINERFLSKISDDADRKTLVKKLINLDKTEYTISDFSKGEFSSPDVENCIQKSDFHIINLKKEHCKNYLKENKLDKKGSFFLTREEQLMKLVSLIMQPGLITPSSSERCMQIANTAKLNSGCISRKVGAIVTDKNFSLSAVGWNDVAKGHTPCNLRNVEDFLSRNNGSVKNNHLYSPFEKGEISTISEYKYKNSKPSNFKEAMADYFEEKYEEKSNDLNGKNCSFCFKTVHNHYEGEANQVHTRSLHAEENAMLQIVKYGGQGIKNGNLFTTASPCELCSKKAYQLGIKYIYYIDPYPGISNDQILKGGDPKKNPILLPFIGAIGNAYHKLYEPFMSYKDEISMTLEQNSNNKLGKKFYYILKNLAKDNKDIKDYLEGKNTLLDDDVLELLKNGLKSNY